MNRLVKLSMLFITFSLLFTACDNGAGNDEIGPATLDVTLQLPDEFANYDKTTIDVVLESVISSEMGQTKKADASGKVSFTDILPGTYKVSAMVSGNYADHSIPPNTGKFKLNGAENNILIKGDEKKEITLVMSLSRVGGLLISEFYYNLTWTPSYDPYLEDPYIHIYNNSDEVIYADGLMIGKTSVINSNPAILGDQDFVYLTIVFRIPGNGTEHPIEPGKYIVLAQDGMNHNEDENGNPGRSIDLSHADFEFWTHDNGAYQQDIDFQNVPNLEQVYFYNGSWDWMPHNSHPGIVLFRTEEFDSYEKVLENPSYDLKVVKVPVSTIIDGFEGDEDGDNSMKHLPDCVITSVFGGITDGWKGLVCKRKVDKVENGITYLQNTKNNNEDFETFEIYPGSSNDVNPNFVKMNLPKYRLDMLRELSNGF